MMEFPYTAWRLTPSYKPAEVRIVKQAYFRDWHCDEKGKRFHTSDLYASQAEAIEAGRQKLEVQAAKMRSLGQLIAKRKTVLDRAAQAGE